MAKKETAKSPANKPADKAVKPEAKKEAKAVILDPSKFYNFESNGKAPTMAKGRVFEKLPSWKIELFLKGGYGKIVD